MPTQTVAPAKFIVKLADRDMVAGIGKGDRLYVQYQATLQASLDLDDAIKVAQMVLRYAERNGIDIQTAAADRDAAGEQWFEQEEGFDLRF